MCGFVADLELIETAQSLGERMQFLLEVIQIGVFAGDSVEILSRGSAFSHRRIFPEFEVEFQLFLFSLCAESWRLA